MTDTTLNDIDPKEPVLSVRNLDIDFWVDGTWYPAVVGSNFDLFPGEVLAIVGESGSGKSTTAMALLGLLPKNSSVRGSIKMRGKEIVGIDNYSLRQIRGAEAAMIFQEPMTALNPVYTVGFQIAEMLRSHQAMSPKLARQRAIELLTLVEIPDPERRVDSYPHQLSGGQRQRAMIAQALAMDPALLIADEPTTALDVTVQAEILKLIRDLRDRIDAGIVLITHDMGVVADLSDRVIVMEKGIIVESGTAHQVFKEPQHAYTQQLLAAVPHLGSVIAGTESTAPNVAVRDTSAPSAVAGELVVDLRDVAIEYPKRGRVPAFRAVDGVTLTVEPGEVVGLVGESGSGKTTIGRAIVGLLPFVSGEAHILGTNMVGIDKEQLRQVRRDVSFVFQDPGSSLNPRLPVGESIGEPLLLQGIAKGDALAKRVENLLDRVHLSRDLRNRYPHELSGGQRQRVGIARALALGPKLLIADEPTSALDVSVQAKVLELFQELQAEIGFACLFISHDLAVVEILARRIAVMQLGQLVEFGPREQILNNPQDLYTKRLLAAVPVPDPDEQRIRRTERDRLLAAAAAEASE
ncbi:ABC transporter ATP-binding protein [Desertimonas flava]|jgi:peptide/nickel transport system ATP-binding protein|uniref:ABC transporter ATP-binding protein n=1 Tax=Desertimonas flava TaxID=2064846 RepID=UPI000E3560EF|nr:ABC transporter ATP-binding protein [Desertimonas flava]